VLVVAMEATNLTCYDFQIPGSYLLSKSTHGVLRLKRLHRWAMGGFEGVGGGDLVIKWLKVG